jgi:16S rRNA (guanine1516-N2)-methyltransferase
LAKAMGLRAGKTPKIVDATAGLGRDSFLLASLGAEVTMIERSDVMHGLLQDGMARARQEGGIFGTILSRMTLLHGDAKALLPKLNAEAILIDPMHPPRKTSALVKRELRQVREIVGTDEDAVALMQVALRLCAPAGGPEMARQSRTNAWDQTALASDFGKIYAL